MRPFRVSDCTLLTSMSGLPAAVNLRELRDRIAICSADVLYHHFCETPMVPFFDNPDYRNDFAVWSKLHLSDRVLAERIGIIDPYLVDDIETLRSQVLDIIDERLSEIQVVPTALPGSEFYFLEATTVVFDAGTVIEHPTGLRNAILNMTNSSIYFHFLEAKRRPPVCIDDFSVWLADWGSDFEQAIQSLRSIDFMFLTLSELKIELANALAGKGGLP
ncbi:MAG: hypothetical protein CXR31_07910 [Geobacter sp.]|nr:MAG: hypothetical protein CXR31_07910 [Geobacter sp.]